MDRLFRFFAIAECRVHDANSLHVRSQATLFCSQPENSGLLMSRQTVDWVSRGVVVSSGSFPLAFLAVSEQGFGFLVSGGGHGLQLFAPRLSQAICSFQAEASDLAPGKWTRRQKTGAGLHSNVEQVSTATWSRSPQQRGAGLHSHVEQVSIATWSRSPQQRGAGLHSNVQR